jgi:hypothetical protein
MSVDLITKNLKEKLQQFSDFDEQEKNNVYGYSFLLRLMYETLNEYVKFSNQNFSDNPELQITPMQAISLYRIPVLFDDFLPMAHTRVPINQLKIVNSQELNNELSAQKNDIFILEQCLKDVIQMIEKIDEKNTLLTDIVNQ